MAPGRIAAINFRDGAIVIVNNALAWGGAERQVVTTMRGLIQRQKKPVVLLSADILHDKMDPHTM